MILSHSILKVKREFLRLARDVHTDHWQGVNIKTRPEAGMKEQLFVTIRADLEGQESLDYHREQVQPNLPWADDHFLERVSGQPLNPGEQWAKWPWGNSADKFRYPDGRFNHNYMERYWPKYANDTSDGVVTDEDKRGLNPRLGIRFQAGDLDDMIAMLANDPLTRQAYLPVWFPEDTGQPQNGRKPCTLGYHFIMRAGRLHCVYYIRSCDLYRHFADDVYLTIRLQLWVLAHCRQLNPLKWEEVLPGDFIMHISSLHCFINDWRLMGGK